MWLRLFPCGLFVAGLCCVIAIIGICVRQCKNGIEISVPRSHDGENHVTLRAGDRGKQPKVSIDKWWIYVLCLLQCVRIGEASHPGPSKSVEWVVGTFNPNGLGHRADIVASLPGDFWGVTETHLSRIGIQKFSCGLRCNQSDYVHVVPGKPCPLRARSKEAGDFTGVAALSKWPCRSLPHSIPSAIYDSSRVQVVGTCIQGIWITIGILYGFPKSTSHIHPKFSTEQHLEAIIDRVACQSCGPRIIMGDFNWEQSELHQLSRLEDLGFVEIQSLANSWWGTPILPTGTGSRRIDYVYISKELVGLFKGVTVDDSQWPDHSSVSATFQSHANALEKFQWFIPKKPEWPSHPWQFEFCPSDHHSPSIQYAEFWQQVEQQASNERCRQGKTPFQPCEKGRGQTLETKQTSFCSAPIRKGRSGEMHPAFYGNSVKYKQIFKQARRLQSFVRALQSDNANQLHHLPSLWDSICRSSGFPGGFCRWWECEGSSLVAQPISISYCIPSLQEAELIYQAVQRYVKSFEQKLIRERVKNAKQKRLNDLRYVFKDCQRDQPKKVDILIDSRHCEVTEIIPEDSAIVVEPSIDILSDVPICHNGRPFEVIHAEADCIWVDDHSAFSVGDSIRQTKVLSDVPSIFEAFRKEWEPRWNRVTKILPSQWTQITDFARKCLPKTPWTFRSWDPSSFQGAVRGKKRNAATGPDGVSRDDLLALPQSVHERIIGMYKEIEESNKWPTQLTVGIVSSLEKKPDAFQTVDYRPIVVFPLLYRVWASFRAKDFLQSFVAIVPDGVKGGIPSRQAKSIWYEAAILLERAHLDSEAYIGVVADLSKAFNMLPREPIWVALDAMGVPVWFIKTWASYVTCQSRRFKIRDSVGPPIFSDVGFPEGCALSICSMAIIDALLDCWLRPVHPTVQIVSYVDDWQIMHRSLQCHEEIIQALWDFVDAVRMKIDKTKTFAWATSPQDRKVLRQSSNMKIVLCAKELGAHLNFCKKIGNRSILDRIGAMGHAWQLLRKSLSPYHHKITALRMLAWPRSLYGISVVRLGPLNYAALRTGALRGLRQDRIGSNPCLHLPLSGFSCDPEGYAIFQTIKDARDHAEADSFRNLLGLYGTSPSLFPSNGPVTILAGRVSRLGWKLQPDGRFRDNIGFIDVFTTHIDDIKFRIALAWGWILTAELNHRKDFDGLQRVDLGTTGAILRQFSAADQVYLRCSLDGTMVTQKDRKHFQEGNLGLCAFCGAEDSSEHRVWMCPEFATIRKTFPTKYVECLQTLPPCTVQHAWAIRPQSYDKLAEQFEALSDLPPSAYKIPLVTSDYLDLFCDGTCRFPHAKPLKMAAWAVTMAHSKGNGYDNDLLAAGVVPGQHQSAFRAELFGFRHALAIAVEVRVPVVRIWCDCQSVVNMAIRMQKGLLVEKPNGSHADVWNEVRRLLLQLDQRLMICHVFSHNQISSGLSEIEMWAYWHNSLTDIAAAKMNGQRTEEFWESWRQAASDFEWYDDLFTEVAKLHVTIGKQADALQKTVRNHKKNVDVQDVGKQIVQPKKYIVTTAAIRKHGANIVQTLHEWWMHTGARFFESEWGFTMDLICTTLH